MNTPPNTVSVTAAAGRAFDRVREVLFQPFDLGRWFVIGFTAWLATLGESWGGGGGGGGGGSRGGGGPSGFNEFWDDATRYVTDNLHWIAPAVIAGVFLILLISALILWLSSRGRFMFLHNVAKNRAEVIAPWNEYGRDGDRLFLFRLILALCSFCLVTPFVLLGGWPVFGMLRREEVAPAGVAIAVVGFGTAILLGISFFIIAKLTRDFVVPVMYLRRTGCRAAWGEFGALLRQRPLDFVIYLLFHLVLSIAVGVAVLAVVLLTCCIAGCFLAIPYLGTVLLLPVLVFFRSFSIAFLAQFGDTCDVFRPPQPPAPATP